MGARNKGARVGLAAPSLESFRSVTFPDRNPGCSAASLACSDVHTADAIRAMAGDGRHVGWVAKDAW